MQLIFSQLKSVTPRNGKKKGVERLSEIGKTFSFLWLGLLNVEKITERGCNKLIDSMEKVNRQSLFIAIIN